MSSFEDTAESLSAAYGNGGSFTSEVFRTTAKRLMHSDPSLNVLLLYSYDDGPLYFLPRSPSDYSPDEINFSGTSIPRIRSGIVNEKKFTKNFIVPGRTGIVLEAVYSVLGTDQLYPFLKDLLIVYSIFFLVTCLFIVAGGFIRNDLEKVEPLSETLSVHTDHGFDEDTSPLQPEKSVLQESGFRDHIPEYRPDKPFEDFSIDIEDLGGPGIPEPDLGTDKQETPETAADLPGKTEGSEYVEPPVERKEASVIHDELPGEHDSVSPTMAGILRKNEKTAEIKSVIPEREAKSPDSPDSSTEMETSVNDLTETESVTHVQNRRIGDLEFVLNDPERTDGEITLALIGVWPGIDAESKRRMHALIETSYRDIVSIIDYEDEKILVILYDTELDSAIEDTEKLYGHIHYEMRENIRAGLTIRNGRVIDARHLLKEAEQALKRTRNERGERIIGFKPDPERYKAKQV